jgi:hypothetical protein
MATAQNRHIAVEGFAVRFNNNSESVCFHI